MSGKRAAGRVAERSPAWPTPVYLLDVNVLIALIDPLHSQHAAAHDWFFAAPERAWATCALTQNGVLRIIGSRTYPNGLGSPAEVVPLLTSLCAVPGHRYWTTDASLLDPDWVDAQRLAKSAQVTDTYLLATAAKNAGKLATFDRRLVTSAVTGGAAALHVIG